MTPAELSRTVLHAVCRAVEDGVLDAPVPESVSVERPRPGGSGDYATNVALRLAGPTGQQPRAVAEVLRDRIAEAPGIASVEITGPGFLNITLGEGAQQALVRRVLEQGSDYGWVELTGEIAQPSYRAEVRAAVVADALRRILGSQGVLVRTSCEGKADPVWVELRVRIEAQEGRGRLPADVTPVPADDDAATLVRRLGVDAARWGLLSAASHDRPRTGDELLVQQESNPLFKVRYAYSRTRALARGAKELGFARATDPAAYTHVDAPALTAAIGDYPAVLASAARLRAPDRLVRHLEATADALLAFQHTVLPLGDENDGKGWKGENDEKDEKDEKPMAAHPSRLALAEAAGTVLAGGLSLLGISAPEYL
ncbi:ArgS-related anticodon-binding protein NrtL [Streptomyces sp. NPDC019890]|uniref:ArgS-related anticodon-binding protein NrtL n=1 Tax=Streptomyces sp. NPDC019890 TaxID=3365064 RepID=UPI0038517D26